MNIMGIPYCENMRILGTHFTSTTSQSALKRWSLETEGLRTQAREAYYRVKSQQTGPICPHLHVSPSVVYRTGFPVATNLRTTNQNGSIMVPVERRHFPSTTIHPPMAETAGRVGLDQCWIEVQHYYTSDYRHKEPSRVLRQQTGFGSGNYRHQALISPRSNGYWLTQTTCTSLRWMEHTLPRNRGRKRAKHTSNIFISPWLHYSKRCLNPCDTSQTYRLPWTGCQHGVNYMTPAPKDIKMDWYRAIHKIVPTQDRLNRINGRYTPPKVVTQTSRGLCDLAQGSQQVLTS